MIVLAVVYAAAGLASAVAIAWSMWNAPECDEHERPIGPSIRDRRRVVRDAEDITREAMR